MGATKVFLRLGSMLMTRCGRSAGSQTHRCEEVDYSPLQIQRCRKGVQDFSQARCRRNKDHHGWCRRLIWKLYGSTDIFGGYITIRSQNATSKHPSLRHFALTPV